MSQRPTTAAGAIDGEATRSRIMRWAVTCALLVHLILGAAYALTAGGLQYDEAIMVRGAVHMLWGVGPPPFPHHRGSWVRVGDRWLPLMIMPYVGAVPAYLAAPLFALTGPSPVAIRLAYLLLSTLGILGIVWLVWSTIDPGAGVVLAWLLALHPSLLAHTVLDNSVVALWMAAMGLSAAAALHALRRPGWAGLALLGLALGLGVWIRLNLLWLIAAAAIAGAAVVRPSPRALLRRAPSLFLGGLLASSPLLAYELASGFGTAEFIRRMHSSLSLGERAATQLAALAVLLVSDGERRAVWGGPPPPAWVVATVTALALLALAVAAAPGHRSDSHLRRWGRGTVLCLLLFLAVSVSSGLNVAAHHLVTAVPLVGVAAAIAVRRALTSGGGASLIARGGLATVLAISLWWNATAVAGMARTGGLGLWSGALPRIADDLDRLGVPEVVVGDWGFGNTIYTLTAGRVLCRELFWGARPEGPHGGETWIDVVAEGGAFLLAPAEPSNVVSNALRSAIRARRGAVAVHRYHDSSGRPVAELYLLPRREPRVLAWGPRTIRITPRTGGADGPRLWFRTQGLPHRLLVRVGDTTVPARVGTRGLVTVRLPHPPRRPGRHRLLLLDPSGRTWARLALHLDDAAARGEDRR